MRKTSDVQVRRCGVGGADVGEGLCASHVLLLVVASAEESVSLVSKRG